MEQEKMEKIEDNYDGALVQQAKCVSLEIKAYTL